MPSRFLAKPQTPVLNRGHPLMRGLRMCYPLQNPTGDSGDSLQHVRDIRRNITHSSTADLARNPYGWGLDFPNSDDDFDTGFTETPAEWSYSVIFLPPTSATSFEVVWVKRGTGTFGSLNRDDTTAAFGTNFGGGVDAPAAVTNGEWAHIVGRHYAPDTIDTIVDGGRAYAVNTGASGTIGDGDLRVGRDTPSGLIFSGEVAFFAWWNRKLTDQEVAGHYADPWAMIRPRRTFLGKGFVGIFPDSWMPEIQQPSKVPLAIASY